MRADSRVRSCLGHVPVEQPSLDRPVDLAVDEREIVGLDGLERAPPQLQDPARRAGRLVDQAASLGEVVGLLEVLPLHRQGRQLAARW